MTSPAPVDDVLRGCGLLTLGIDPGMDAVETCLRNFALVVTGADPLRREALREGAIQALKGSGMKSPAKLVDAALAPPPSAAPMDNSQGHRLALTDPDPWPDPVDGVELLAELVQIFPRYLALPPGAPTALALWTIHAHAHDAATVSPLCAITSPMKRCGKTTALSLLGALVPRPVPSSNITAAALFRTVERWGPTLLVDEADSFLRDKEDLRGILNSGHTRGAAFVVRTVGDDHEARLFSTWAPKAIALIGKLPDTLTDRSIEVSMRRKGAGETVERLRLDRLGELDPLRRRCWTWAQANMDTLKGMDPTTPSGLHDRAADNWRPLLAIADAAGGPWPERARKAASLLSGQTEDDEAATLLLVDLKAIFTDRNADRLTSTELVETLVGMEERPWPEWRRGQPLSTRGLARLLRPYGVKPRPMDWSGLHPKGTRGYEREWFTEVWERYLPRQDTPPEPQPPQPSNNSKGFQDLPKCNRSPGVADAESGESPVTSGMVAEVADEKGVSEGEDVPRYSEVTADLFEEVAR